MKFRRLVFWDTQADSPTDRQTHKRADRNTSQPCMQDSRRIRHRCIDTMTMGHCTAFSHFPHVLAIEASSCCWRLVASRLTTFRLRVTTEDVPRHVADSQVSGARELMGHVAITGGYVRRCRAFNVVARRSSTWRNYLWMSPLMLMTVIYNDE